MIQQEFRLMCQGIQLISVFEVEESSKGSKEPTTGFTSIEKANQTSSQARKEDTTHHSNEIKEGLTF